jgi:2-amino-4-hydroxy-6-hydroxymethyldihydropteridine diphosphokinase
MSTTTHQACLLLGSNIEPALNLPRAVALLQEKLVIRQLSSVWESPSTDCCYPDYLNMAVLAETLLDAQQLKYQLLRPLEASMGRVRTEDKNAARPIDIDIVLFDGVVIDSTLWHNAHRAIPISEIFPRLRVESGETLKALARRMAKTAPIQVRKDISFPLQSSS